MNREQITVLGIGNILIRDDGAGIKALESLKRYTFPENVRLIDAGTTIYHNMNIMTESDKLLVLDAVKLDGKPGTIYSFTPEEFRIKLPRKANSHDVGLLEALSTLTLIEEEPPETVIIGIQPLDYSSWGEELTDEVNKGLPMMIEKALKQLKDWGIEPQNKL
ncbi:MAG: HyaD/HybD family hydrogenase maturation endopeptidase [Nitrospinae bacterium]|nr:HyaD/HybD family hydrogenase maturation endopeptidase [Nitrospinota bacterium]